MGVISVQEFEVWVGGEGDSIHREQHAQRHACNRKLNYNWKESQGVLNGDRKWRQGCEVLYKTIYEGLHLHGKSKENEDEKRGQI